MNKKGFTLIELLAVIVILAIIAVIAVPKILNVVEEAKKKSAESSALGYIDAVEKHNMIKTVNENSAIPDGEYEDVVDFNADYDITIKGNLPTAGELTLLKGKVTSAILCIGGYEVSYNGSKATAGIKCSTTLSPRYKITYNANGGTGAMNITKNIVATNAFTKNNFDFKEWNTAANGSGTSYKAGDTVPSDITLYAIWEHDGPLLETTDIISSAGVKQKGVIGTAYMNPSNLSAKCYYGNSSIGSGTNGCMRWYVYSDDTTNNKYKLILDHNTANTVSWNDSKSAVPYNQSGAYTAIQNLVSSNNWNSSLATTIITAYEINAITGNTNFNYGEFTSRYYFDTMADGNPSATGRGTSAYAWLYDYTYGCTSNGCDVASSDSKDYFYFTQNTVSVYGKNSYVWSVRNNGYFYTHFLENNGYIGCIRPVVTVSKTIFD